MLRILAVLALTILVLSTLVEFREVLKHLYSEGGTRHLSTTLVSQNLALLERQTASETLDSKVTIFLRPSRSRSLPVK